MTDLLKKRKKLHQKIDKFLGSRGESTGGYAEVKPNDVLDITNIIYLLLELKYQRDSDGDLPIECLVIDRTLYNRMCYQPTVYLHKLAQQSKEEIYAALRDVSANVSIASDYLDIFIKYLLMV